MVLVRREGKWVEASLTSFVNEAELQQILLDSPELIPGCTGVAIVKEMAIPGVGKVDLVAVNELGQVWLVECKLQSNSEIRRGVIGQILAYAGGMWKIGYNEFDQQFSARADMPLLEAVADGAGAVVDADKFRAHLEVTLDSGRFRLVIAIDQITDELKRIVEYVNEHTDAEFALTALELGYLHEGDVEVLVPVLYGTEIPSGDGPSTQRWTEEAVGEAIAKLDAPRRQVIEALMAHAHRARARFKGGTSIDPSGGYYYRIGGKTKSLWSLWSAVDAIVSINFASVAGADVDLAKELLDKLVSNPLLAERLTDVHPDSLHKFPRIPADVLAAGQALDTLLHGFDTVIDHPWPRAVPGTSNGQGN